MNDQQQNEFEEVTKPVIAWINANFHPHVIVVIDPTSAVLSEGTLSFTTEESLRD